VSLNFKGEQFLNSYKSDLVYKGVGENGVGFICKEGRYTVFTIL
jgi:hypothetical protein